MELPGIPSTRWFDATMYDKKDVSQKDNIKCMFVMGHGGNTVTRMPNAQKGIEALDNKVPTAAQHSGYQEIRRLIDRATRWFVDVRFPIGDVAALGDTGPAGRAVGQKE